MRWRWMRVGRAASLTAFLSRDAKPKPKGPVVRQMCVRAARAAPGSARSAPPGPRGRRLRRRRLMLPPSSTQAPTSLFFTHNAALGPPYRVLIDTNFINFSIKNKLDLVKGMMDCLYAHCTPCVTDCVMAELEKLGTKYRVSLLVAKDPRVERLPCTHAGTYADDCLCERVTAHKCYIVATCDKDLRRRIRKIPGVPIMYITRHQYSIERMPEATVGGAPIK